MDDVEITNSKLAGHEPRWALFRGFSLLFENPSDSGFFRALRETVRRLASDSLVTQNSLRLLPPESYHVTAWDGVNDGNLPQVFPHCRADWEAFLRGIPHAHYPVELFREILNSDLAANPDWNLRLRGERIENWNNVSLVARLVPADDPSSESLARLIAARDALSNVHAAKFGVAPHPGYAPHVTLGYFANERLASSSAASVERWNAALLSGIAGQTLVFRRILPSVFTDMASFGRDTPLPLD